MLQLLNQDSIRKEWFKYIILKKQIIIQLLRDSEELRSFVCHNNLSLLFL